MQTFRRVYNDRVFRATATSLFLAGMGVSMAFPLLTLFFVEELGATPAVAGSFFLTGLVGPVIGIVTGKLSDELASRRSLIRITAFWLAAGWLAFSLTEFVWLAIAIGILFFSFIGTLSAQLFAQLRDYIQLKAFDQPNQLVATVRTAYAAGWIVGPIIGNWIGLSLGLRQLFVLTALLYVGSQIPLRSVFVARETASDSQKSRPDARVSVVPVAVFAGLCALVMSGETLKLSFLPIYMAQQLGLPSWMQGAVISTQPLLELALIPAMGVLADRLGSTRVLMLGAAAGVAGNVLFAFGQTTFTLFFGQTFIALLVATIFGVGVTTAQNLYPNGAGYASSVFFGGLSLSTAIGGLVGSVGVAKLDIPTIFILPAILSGLVGLGFYLVHVVWPETGIVQQRANDTID